MNSFPLTLAAVLLLGLPAANAADNATKPALDLSVPDDALDFELKPEARQFLDKSVVRVPKSTGKYTLLKASYDPKDPGTGVSTAWRVKGAPEGLTLTVYAYPMGRAPEADVVKNEIAKVATVIEMTSDAQWGERVPFVVVRGEATAVRDEKIPLPAFDPTPRSETKPAHTPGDDEFEPLRAKYWKSPNDHGIRQSFSMKIEGVPARSLAYVFYSHLFAKKVRISVPETAMDQAAFEKLADEAARWLVPQIDVQNYGTCGTVTVYHEPPGVDFEEWAKESLVRAFSQIQYENCGTIEDTHRKQPNNVEKVDIAYPAHAWDKR